MQTISYKVSLSYFIYIPRYYIILYVIQIMIYKHFEVFSEKMEENLNLTQTRSSDEQTRFDYL